MNDCFAQFDAHLKSCELSWLLGAGISYDANLPLMYPLTKKIRTTLAKESRELFRGLFASLIRELPEHCHIEHILSHLGDYIALAERHKDNVVYINSFKAPLVDLEKLHALILSIIADVIKCGYITDTEGNEIEQGTIDKPIVKINTHLEFIDNLFTKSFAGISEQKRPINLFTTNYDTLLEDALALNRIPYWDGFSGGAVAFRSFTYGDDIPLAEYRANVVKLHGSIDWFMCDKGYVWRIRDKDTYPKNKTRVLIYPKATKYVATQQDPFSSQFDLLRRTLNSPQSNVLAICGYSFGDEHINNEIEFALSKETNKTVLLIFTEGRGTLPPILDKWLSLPFSDRLYIASSQGLYAGNKTPIKPNDYYNDCWTFKGVTHILENGWGQA